MGYACSWGKGALEPSEFSDDCLRRVIAGVYGTEITGNVVDGGGTASVCERIDFPAFIAALREFEPQIQVVLVDFGNKVPMRRTAERFGVRAETIRRNREKALRKLRHPQRRTRFATRL